MKWRIGNGESIRIEENWKQEVNNPLRDDPLFHGPLNIKVKDLWDQNRAWRVPLLEVMFSQSTIHKIMSIYLSSSQQSREDVKVWAPMTTGVYSVKSGYYKACNTADPHLASGRSKEAWKKLWSLSLHGKLQWFIWRVANNVVPSLKNLDHRGLEVQTLCKSCESGEEDLHHIFLDCIAARKANTQILEAHYIVRTDGAFKKLGKQGAGAWELFDSNGNLLTAGSDTFHALTALQAEATASLRGIKEAQR
ncbi:OLC1v1016986C1 [Oldenlandia corymbosa var. corymbosa]|uniref:OLC1v1016986C1 n=1 Tax=Oldenlandia corymbosa var. corymbosa TaxID=529605 RepID=A0AAV1E8I1_OLDCO|nr:OLC1v1016986C1 [Oldenlandia corymbosa var. corymbosa]